MATRPKRSGDWITKVDAEIDNWPGVSAVRQFSGNKHNRLILSFGDKTRFVVYPSSPTKASSAVLNHIQDVRRVLRELGARRITKKDLTSRKNLPSDSPSITNHRETNQ